MWDARAVVEHWASTWSTRSTHPRDSIEVTTVLDRWSLTVPMIHQTMMINPKRTLRMVAANSPIPFFIENSRLSRITKSIVTQEKNGELRISHRWETSLRRRCKWTDWSELRYWIQSRITAGSTSFHKRCDTTCRQGKRSSGRGSS